MVVLEARNAVRVLFESARGWSTGSASSSRSEPRDSFGAAHRLLGADHCGARREELGDIVAEIDPGSTDPSASEAHNDDPVVREDEAAGGGGAVRDARVVEPMQQRPCLAQWSIVVRRERAQIASVDPTPHEHALAVADPMGPPHLGGGHTVARGEHHCEGFVLDRPVGVPDVIGIDGIAERRKSPQPIQPVRVTPVPIRDTNVQGYAVDGVDTKGAPPRIDRFDRADLEAFVGQPRREHARVRKTARCPEHEMDRRADHPADRETPQDVGREVGTYIHTSDRNQRDQQPSGTTRRAAEIRARHGCHRRRDRDMSRRK